MTISLTSLQDILRPGLQRVFYGAYAPRKPYRNVLAPRGWLKVYEDALEEAMKVRHSADVG